MHRMLGGLVALALLVVCAGQASAGPITVFNTGVDAGGNPLPDGTIGDPHYTLTVVPGGSTTAIRVRTSAGGFPIGPWVGDNSSSAWIGPNNDGQVDGPVGQYHYVMTFTLASPGTVNFTGQWSTDNEGVDILLNGLSTGNSIPDPTSFTSFHNFTITGNGVSGLNTLDFVVNNDGGPTGLRVEFFTANATPAVPEPSTLSLAAIGLTGLLGYGWRCRRKTANV
jgi:hypothetical protein